jgi:protein-S-isoprenylcysteine O-methyltransferase Ste14
MGIMAQESLLHLIYGAGLLFGSVIRRTQHRQAAQSRVVLERPETRSGKAFLILQLIGMILIPLVYIFTPLFAFADYRLPGWAGAVGALLMAGSLLLLWRAHFDLGMNWSSRLRIREEHELVECGVYRRIRHPMYASHWLWGLAQVLLLHNWVAGFATLYTYLPFYLHRVPREERLMLERFGDEYRSYMRRTGRITPKLRA